MDKKNNISQKEKDALRAKREKERRAEEKKKAAEKHAKVVAADKARKQKKREKAKIQKEKIKEQRAKEKAIAEKKAARGTVENNLAGMPKEIKKPDGSKKNGKQKSNAPKSPEKKPAPAQKVAKEQPINEPVEKSLEALEQPELESTEKSTVIASETEFTQVKNEKPTKTKKQEKAQKPKKEKKKSAVQPKAFKKIGDFFKKAFSKKYRLISIGVIAAVLIGTTVSVSILSYRNWLITTVAEGYNYYGIADTRAKDIEISKDKQLERAEAMETHGQKRVFEFFSETNLVFNKWYSNGKLIFGNVSQNNCDLVVTIFGEDGKTVLYRSDGVLPGSYLSEIRLFEPLDSGEYNCRMFVAGYNSQTNALVGVQYVNIKLTVGGE